MGRDNSNSEINNCMAMINFNLHWLELQRTRTRVILANNNEEQVNKETNEA